MEAPKKPSLLWLVITTVATPVAIITALVIAVKEVPGVLGFLTWSFANVGTNGQVVVVVIAGLGLAYFAFVSLKREERVAELKGERDLLEGQLRSKEAELKQVEENNIRLAEEGVKEDIWRRDVIGVPTFVEKQDRNARFISLLNLKGGVGKTTLAANLGVCLALMEKPLKVLLIDLDFQATLSNMSVEASTLLTAVQFGNTVSKLLEPKAATIGDFKKLVLPVNKVPNGRVVIADAALDRMDFQTQAKFFLEAKNDVRFLFRSVLHQREVTDNYDVVIFDCPPRLTTSTVNALSCSDYVLIPSKLDERSFEAIPRTLSFLNNLRTIAQPKIIGVVANEVQLWRGKPFKIHQGGMARLKELVKASDPDLYVFDAMVELCTDAAFHREKNLVPSVHKHIRDEFFLGVASELRKRIGK